MTYSTDDQLTRVYKLYTGYLDYYYVTSENLRAYDGLTSNLHFVGKTFSNSFGLNLGSQPYISVTALP
jgi:hypothetical protein